MTCTRPISVKVPTQAQGLIVPCGKCMACRVARAREWSTRIMHEMGSHEDAVFATLTYDNEHLPADGSISKDELQRFMKRLRKAMGGRKIRYYACGEYGETYKRPHYHACLFGLDFSEDRLLWTVRSGFNVYRSKVLEDCWPSGLCEVGSFSVQGAA